MRLIEQHRQPSVGVTPPISTSAITYDQVIYADPSFTHRREGRIVPVRESDPRLTLYNGFPLVDSNNGLHLFARSESEQSEVAKVVKLDFTHRRTSGGSFLTPNGLVIDRAQDPSVSLVAPDRVAIGVVAITNRRGKIAEYWPQLYEFEEDGVSREKVATGPKSQKDIRVAYMGSYGGQDLSVIGARVRRVVGSRIDSYLQLGVVPTAKDMGQLSQDIAEVKNDPSSRLDVLLPDGKTWFGPNQITPLQSQSGDLAFGLLFHTGRWADRLYKNDELGRDYLALVTEISADPDTMQVTGFTKPKVVATARNFPYIGAKRPDLGNVYFPGGFVFGIKNGLVERTVLVGGVRDSNIGWLDMSYPFSRPLNLELNRLSVLPVEKMPNF